MLRSLRTLTGRPYRLTFLVLGGVAFVVSHLLGAEAVGEAVESAVNEIPWPTVWMQLLGGLALFLLGMEVMSDAIKAVAGDGLRGFLQRMTGNRFLGAFSGALITGILNSSSVTTVLVVGFISAGLMSLTQAISIIMGANIGSTFAAQIIAFNVTQYALLPVALGYLMRFISKSEHARNYGDTIMGLGLIFFGMGLMGAAMTPLRDYQPFLDLMLQMDKVFYGVMVGAVFTALIQSSAATTGIAIAMASGGLITLEAGVALALGANIGTCVTAVLATIGKSRSSVRAAVAHVLINVVGVAAWVWFIPQFCDVIRAISPSDPALTGAEKLSAEVPRQIANAHTVFNVANTFVLIWFTGLLSKLCMWIVPDKPEKVKPVIEPKFLDKELLDTPSLAMQRVQLEIGRIQAIIDKMFRDYEATSMDADLNQLREVARDEENVNVLAEHIFGYLSAMPREKLSERDGRQLLLLITANNYMRSLGEVLKTDIIDIVQKARDQGIVPSERMRVLMRDLYATIWRVTVLCLQAVSEDDPVLAKQVLEASEEVKRNVRAALEHQAEQLSPDHPERLAIFRVEMEFIDNMKRIYDQAKRVAKMQLSLAKS
ncbi:MAG: Na/Pi cotransporter family protein [Coraliomargarita sp.]